MHAVLLQKKASLPPAKSGSFSPKSGSFLSFFARPRAIALGSKPLAGSSVRSHSACRPGDEAASECEFRLHFDRLVRLDGQIVFKNRLLRLLFVPFSRICPSETICPSRRFVRLLV